MAVNSLRMGMLAPLPSSPCNDATCLVCVHGVFAGQESTLQNYTTVNSPATEPFTVRKTPGCSVYWPSDQDVG